MDLSKKFKQFLESKSIFTSINQRPFKGRTGRNSPLRSNPIVEKLQDIIDAGRSETESISGSKYTMSTRRRRNDLNSLNLRNSINGPIKISGKLL